MKYLFFVFCFLGCHKEQVKSSSVNLNLSGEVLPIVVLAGQSNMQGTTKDTSQTPQQFRPLFRNTLIYYDSTLQFLKFGVNNNYYAPSHYFGPECPVAYYMDSIKIGIIKYAHGDTYLVASNRSKEHGSWQIDADTAFGVRQYSILMDFVKPAMDSFRNRGYAPRIVLFAWCQGESDATDSFCAYNYQHELSRLFKQFKKDVNDSNVHFSITQTRFKSRPYDSVIRNAQRLMAANFPNCKLIVSDSWPQIYDSLHFSKVGQGKHGQAIANVFKSALK